MPAASAPIHECLVPDSLFDIGIGNVIVSRKMPNGFIGAAFFLVDVFCLGIKDVFYEALSPAEYDSRVSSLQHETFRALHPTCARKLVEGAEAYARDLGFIPTTNVPGRFLATSTPSLPDTLCVWQGRQALLSVWPL